LCAGLLLVGGCERPKEPPGRVLTPEEASAATVAMVEWFECEECEQGELQAVVKYGQAIVPTLRSSLLHGASPASRELMRRELEKRYDELLRYQKDHPKSRPASSKKEFVEMYLANFDAQYRTRAAHALGAIGGEAARKALEEAQTKVKRADERESVKAALTALEGGRNK